MMHNPELDLAFDFIQYTNRNVYLTGKAGTGKTTFLHKLKEVSPKRMVVVAPTGVAAINAGGVTIHSFFQLPFGPLLPGRLEEKGKEGTDSRVRKFNKRKINLIRSLDLLVIDEISMVRADLLDGIDTVLRQYKNKTLPFGGVQMLMIGDLQQLPPVIKEDEWAFLKQYYETGFFFSSKAFNQSKAVTIELKHIYRQQDDAFIKILNEIRDDKLSPESVRKLNERYIPGFSPEKDDGYIILTTHNATANRINEEQLKKVKTPLHTFEAEVSGQFPEYSYPADQFLSLKEGAQVMFIKNDSSPEKRYYNGKIGVVTQIDENGIYVKSKDEEYPILVDHERWENIKYTIDDSTREIAEEVSGIFLQYPLRLSWAITIHKSQGLTFEKAVIDANAAFAHGQTYVALSRCKTLEGLILRSSISSDSIICSPVVGSFNRTVEKNQPDEKILDESKKSYRLVLLDELFSYWQIQYQLEKCKKIELENHSVIIGNLPEKLDLALKNGTRILIEVAKKFSSQLSDLSGTKGNENQLQERIRKAVPYFLEKTNENILTHLKQLSFETDNKAVGKSLNETLLKIRELLAVKLACMNTCKNGFVLKDYLHARAVAALEQAGEITASKIPEEKEYSEHPMLYNRLREWRNKTAEKRDIPVYFIAPQKVLITLSNQLPRSPKHLKKIKGMGKKKIETYGDQIVEIIQDYCDEKDIADNFDYENEPEIPKKDTKTVSFELFKEGKSIAEIAAIRNFAVSTIEGHLAHFIGIGEIQLSQFIDDDKSKTIITWLNKNPGSNLSLAKEALGDSFSYSELKFVRAYLEYLSKTNSALNSIKKL